MVKNHSFENRYRLDIAVMIRYQQAERFQNQDTQKLQFNRFERSRLLTLLVIMEVALLALNIAIVVLQIQSCNTMTQRLIDIGVLSCMIVFEVAIGLLFIHRVRANRRSTWVKTKIEVTSYISHMVCYRQRQSSPV